MSKTFLTILFSVYSISLSAQNLVPNYSFELYYGCPDNYNQVDSAVDWHRSFQNNNFTHHTDYLHTCGGNIGADYFTVPGNLWGYQNAYSGLAYMSISTVAPTIFTDYRENFYCQLVQPLTIGHDYTVSFKVCKSDRTQNATNRIGIKFSTDTVFAINNFCHLNTVNLIADTSIWTSLSTNFIADSAYKYLAVGNFFTDANTNIVNICPACPRPESEYYVDDICVHRLAGDDCSIPLSISEPEIDTQFSDFICYQEELSNKIHVLFSNAAAENLTIRLFNALGQLISETQGVFMPGKNTVSLNTTLLSNSIYFVSISKDGSHIYKEIILKK